jgi:hypothetical protein
LNFFLFHDPIEHIKSVTSLRKLEFLRGYLCGSKIKIGIVRVILIEGLSILGVLKVKNAVLEGRLDDEKGE